MSSTPITRLVRASGAALFLVTFGLAASPVLSAQVTSSAKIESHIQDMHAKLGITAEQEGQWKAVAQVMRDNEAAIAPLIEQRKANTKAMTAIDDLNSYAQISAAHVEGIRNFTTAFTTLYAAMSELQKKDADTMFRNGIAKGATAK